MVCNWQVSASSEWSLVLRACVSEPPIHVVSPQPADFHAAALSHSFILHATNLNSMIFCNGNKIIIQRFKLWIHRIELLLHKQKMWHFNYNRLRTLIEMQTWRTERGNACLLFELVAANWPAGNAQPIWKTSSTLSCGVILKWVGGMPYITSGISTDRRQPLCFQLGSSHSHIL